jgi:transposase
MSKARVHSWEAIQTTRRWTRVHARWVLGEFARSGLSVTAFAKRHGLDSQRIYCWRARLKGEVQPKLVEVAIPRALAVPARASERIDIELRCGRRLGVPVTIDVDSLRRVVEALEF